MRWPVCSAPPADPAISTGTQRSVMVVLGATTQPPPMPATSSAGATHKPTDPEGATHRITAAAARPSTTNVSPVTVRRRPQRATRRPPTTAEAAEPTANGVTASPDCSGV